MLKAWATPLTIGSFLLIAATGILMFFHLDSGLNKLAHEWLGWAMIAAVGLHAAVHFRVFQRYFTQPRALAAIGIFVVLFAASFIRLPGRADRPPHAMAVQAVLDAPLELTARLAGKDAQAVRERLRAAGIDIDMRQSLRDAAGPARARQMRALAVVFGKEDSH